MGTNREREIEDAVIAHPEAIGFPGATAIRNVRVGRRSGRIDLMLFPRSDGTKLVLIEAKHDSAPEAISKVVGQLLMYYAGALRIGSVGIDHLRNYSQTQRERALSRSWISPKEITGGVTPPSAAWDVIESGAKLRPEEVRLVIALSGRPHEALRETVSALEHYHSLTIELVVVQNGQPVAIKPHAR